MTDTTIPYPRPVRTGESQSDARRVAATLEMVDTLKGDFQARDDLYERIDATIFGAHDYAIPKGYKGLGKPRHNPLAVYFTNTITAALTVDPPQVQFPQTGTTETAQANATLREHFFDASWERQEEEAEAPLFRRFTHSVVCKGEGILKTLPRAKSAWSTYTSFSKELTERLTEGDLKSLDTDSKDRLYDSKTEEYKKTVAPYPIRSTDVDPLTFYYWKGEDGLTLALEHKEVPYLETLTRYGMALDRSGRVVPQGMGQALPAREWRSAMSGTTTLTMTEAWTWDSCFPAETLVSSAAQVRAVSRRWYRGPLVEITTASGQQLAGTPNHPILTDRGWVGLGLLQEGDRVVRGGRLQQGAARHQHDQDVHAPIGQLFDLAHVAGRADVRPVTKLDFHGDGQDGEVDVVPIDRHLWDRIEAALAQPVTEDPLAVGRRRGRAVLAGERGAPQLRGVGGSPEDRGVGGGRVGAPFGLGHPGHPCALGIGAVALESQLAQPLADSRRGPVDRRGDHRTRLALLDVAADQFGVGERKAVVGSPAPPQALGVRGGAQVHAAGEQLAPNGALVGDVGRGDGREGLTAEVALDDIVRVSRRPFAGYVYNLQTESEQYVANGIVVHNCSYILSGQGQFSSSTGDRGQLARSFKHRYGDPVTKSLRGPYAHCLGTSTASRLPERAGLGVLYGFLDLFTMLDELLTVQQINAVITGLASFKRNRPPNAGLGESDYGEDGRITSRQPVTIQPGFIFPDDIGPIEMPKAGEALPATIAQVKEFIDLILPKVLQGVVDTTDSGYQLALAARLGRVAFDPMVSNIRRAAARRVGFESWCIEHEIGETVYAVGTPVTRPGERSAPQGTVLAIGPDDLGGIHRYRVFLQPEDKASELVEVRKHAEMVQAGFESRSMAIEKLGGNWEEVELARTVERVMEKPEIQSQLDQRILQKIGAAQQQHVQQGDQVLAEATAGMGQPPQPGMAPPGAALQGMGQVYEGGQNLPIAPGGPGVPAISSSPPGTAAPGGLPASIPGAPGGMPANLAANLVPPGAGPPLGP